MIFAVPEPGSLEEGCEKAVSTDSLAGAQSLADVLVAPANA
jgi:hypothetical protein